MPTVRAGALPNPNPNPGPNRGPYSIHGYWCLYYILNAWLLWYSNVIVHSSVTIVGTTYIYTKSVWWAPPNPYHLIHCMRSIGRIIWYIVAYLCDIGWYMIYIWYASHTVLLSGGSACWPNRDNQRQKYKGGCLIHAFDHTQIISLHYLHAISRKFQFIYKLHSFTILTCIALGSVLKNSLQVDNKPQLFLLLRLRYVIIYSIHRIRTD